MLNYCFYVFCSLNIGFVIGYSCLDFGYMYVVLLYIFVWVDFI